MDGVKSVESARALPALASRLHSESIVIDAMAPLVGMTFARAVDEFARGGVTAVGATVWTGRHMQGNAVEAVSGIGELRRRISEHSDMVMAIETIEDFQVAKASGRLGVFLNFQNTAPFEWNTGLVDTFHRLGVRTVGLAYNVKNFVGDGCTERTDGGLSKFGVRLVREMNRVGVVVDGAHSGNRTTLDAMEACDAPFLFSHVGCKAVYEHPRNITDEQIRACAATGGVVGIFGFPYLIQGSRTPTLEHLVRHVTHVVELVGIDHVGIGLDFTTGVLPYRSPDELEKWRQETLAQGTWEEKQVPPGPWAFPKDLETPDRMRNLTAALLNAGFTYEEARKVMGENILRLFRATWKNAPRPA